MNMTFGKYKDKPVAWVLINDPSYFSWMRSKGMDNWREYIFALDLVRRLDELPFVNTRCHGSKGCSNEVSRLTLYKGQFNGAYWFCEECDPYNMGAVSGALSSVRTAASILQHSQASDILKAMFKAKGGPERKTEAALKKFFKY